MDMVDDIMKSEDDDDDRWVMMVRKDSAGDTGRSRDTADKKRLRLARRNRNAISLRVMVSVVVFDTEFNGFNGSTL